MKQFATFFIFILLLTSVPNSTQALSCLDPASMLENYVSDPNYTIFTATPSDTVEHVQERAAEEYMFDSGYTGQLLTVSAVHKGTMDSQGWVYYRKDSTWGYLCTNEPPAAGTESLYILSNDNGMFDLPQVVNVYPINSDLANNLLTALAESGAEGYRNDVTEQNLRERIASALREMVFVAKIKLAEWRFWGNQ